MDALEDLAKKSVDTPYHMRDDGEPDQQHRCIERARSRGMRVYDFLAGDAPYKARLGQQLGQMVWCRGQRNRLLLRCERTARALYGGLRA